MKQPEIGQTWRFVKTGADYRIVRIMRQMLVEIDERGTRSEYSEAIQIVRITGAERGAIIEMPMSEFTDGRFEARP